MAILAGCRAACAANNTLTPPPNLATTATIRASSTYSAQYAAAYVADGIIPSPGGHADPGKAWAVDGAAHRHGAELVFDWPADVTIAEAIYYGRTAFGNECWKDFALYIGDAGEPTVTGRLEGRHGAQRIALPTPTRTHRLRFVFTSSYDGPNPGASEIQIFSAPAPTARLAEWSAPEGFPPPPELADSAELTAAARNGQLGFRDLLVIRRHTIHSTHVYTYHQEGLRPGGGVFIATIAPPADNTAETRRSNSPSPRTLIDATDGVVLDAELSYDGKTVLFSWKQRMDAKFQLFTVNVDGTNLRQLTNHDSNNFNACWLPDGGIAFLSDRKPAFAYCWVTTTPILFRCDADGANPVRLSANYLNDFTPSVMDDGRILYSRWEYVDRPAIPIQSLWTVNPDGTGLAGFFGNRTLSPATFMEAHEIPGTGKALCVMTAHNGPCRGAIGIVDPAAGGNAQSAIVNLTPEIDVGTVNTGDGNRIRGPYESPFPLDTTHYLVSRDGTVLLRRYDGKGQTVLLRPSDGGPGFYSPRPLRARPRPALHPSNAIADHGNDEPWGTMLVQDVYTGLVPAIPRGTITQLAVVQEVEKSRFADKSRRLFGFQFPVVSCGATYAPKKVWGYAHVEADGSAHFRVPAGVPIYFMALDQHGRAMQRMRTFTSVMPGERQSCVGCHADRNYAPPAPVARPLAGLRPAQTLETPEWGLAGFSFARVVQPVFDAHCTSCHGARQPAGGLDLSGDKTDIFCVSYDMLARAGTIAENPNVGGCGPDRFGASPYTSWIATYNGMESDILDIAPGRWGSPASRLGDIVLSGHPDTNGQARVALSDAERRRLFAWIDLNVPYYGTSRSRHYDLPGCRRLLPEKLDAVLADIGQRRCAECHAGGRVPRRFFTRIEHPELNTFMLAPLARAAGGTEACGKAVFASTDDPDYLALLIAFAPVARAIADNPRMDMQGATEP